MLQTHGRIDEGIFSYQQLWRHRIMTNIGHTSYISDAEEILKFKTLKDLYNIFTPTFEA
jgi:hypothetical protein